MDYTSQRVKFANNRGELLAGIVDSPQDGIVHYSALFSHCFTCTKDLKAIARISRYLVRYGISTLRFDFAGLGDSAGNFQETSFRTNQEDCLSAAQWCEQNIGAPKLLIGHSLGGAAMITVAPLIESARAVVNIASPANTVHLANYLASTNPEIELAGSGTVSIGNRPHVITRQMVDVLRNTELEKSIAKLTLPLLVMFSPADETLPFSHGKRMFELSGGPATFVTLDGADHLLVDNADDVPFVGDMIGVWSTRYCR